MAETGLGVRLPTVEEIVHLNRRLLEVSGGSFLPPDNLINRPTLEWAVAMAKGEILESDPYPTLPQKGGLLGHTIASRHVFHNGNKRTALATTLLVVRANSYDLAASEDEMEHVARLLAVNEMDLEAFIRWIRSRLCRPS